MGQQDQRSGAEIRNQGRIKRYAARPPFYAYLPMPNKKRAGSYLEQLHILSHARRNQLLRLHTCSLSDLGRVLDTMILCARDMSVTAVNTNITQGSRISFDELA